MTFGVRGRSPTGGRRGGWLAQLQAGCGGALGLAAGRARLGRGLGVAETRR